MAPAVKAYTGALGATAARSTSKHGRTAVKHLPMHVDLTDDSDDSDDTADSSESDSSGSDSECEPPRASTYQLPQTLTMNGNAAAAKKSQARLERRQFSFNQ